MYTHTQYFSVNKHGRDFAVGDIHGCFTRLENALDTVDFNPKTDRLFCVGDLIDRGPESVLALEWLEKPWFHAIQGNHESMVIWAIRGKPNYFADHAAHGGKWLYDLSEKEQLQLQKAFEQLPIIIEVETREGPVGLAHADFPYDDWLQMEHRNIDSREAMFCQWSRERLSRHYTEPIRNIRAAIHGHTPVPTMCVLGNTYFIDTGGWLPDNGYFTLLELGTLKAYTGPSNLKEYNPSHSALWF